MSATSNAFPPGSPATGSALGDGPDRRPRVLLADDHPMMLEGLRTLLERDLEVVGAVRDGRALLTAADELRPDLVVADLSMPGLDGIEATRLLRAARPGTRVLILSVHDEPFWVRAAFEAGACGYLTKGSAGEEVERAVAEVLAGRFYVSPAVARAALEPTEPAGDEPAGGPPRAADGRLTPREQQIVGLVGEGHANKEIAQRLGVSVTTVRSHLREVYGKLGLASRVELALHAVRTGSAG